MPAPAAYPVRTASLTGWFTVPEITGAAPPQPRLLDRARAAPRARHYSRGTEEAPVAWIKRHIYLSGTGMATRR
jgi:hypothetical protein